MGRRRIVRRCPLVGPTLLSLGSEGAFATLALRGTRFKAYALMVSCGAVLMYCVAAQPLTLRVTQIFEL